jgi:uncharacterized protein (TIGR02145 family)
MKKLLFIFAAMLAAGASAQEGVTINGITWATRNVGDKGEFVAKPKDHGNYYTFEEAQTACPEGWRLPTHSEFQDLTHADSKWIKVNGITCPQFGNGKNTFFFPATDENAEDNPRLGGHYWSSTATNTPLYSRFLSFDSRRVYTNGYGTNTFKYSVRCVKE